MSQTQSSTDRVAAALRSTVDGEAYVKARDLASEIEDMSTKAVGQSLGDLADRDVQGLAIERWGKSSGVTWHVRVLATDGGLPDSLDSLVEQASARERLACRRCGDRVARRYLSDRLCPGCRDLVTDGGQAVDDIGRILSEIAEQAATDTTLSPTPDEWLVALPELDELACEWQMEDSIKDSYLWYDDGDYYAANLPPGLEEKEGRPLDRHEAGALLDGVMHKPVDMTEVPQ